VWLALPGYSLVVAADDKIDYDQRSAARYTALFHSIETTYAAR
jgi:hypothetical protein